MPHRYDSDPGILPLRSRGLLAQGLAVLAGVALELGVGAATGRAEAWDAPAYWSLGLPGAALLCAALGAWVPRRAGRFGPLLFGAQFLTLLARADAVGPLTPVGALFAAALGLGGALVGRVAAALDRPPSDAADEQPPRA